MKLIVTLIPFWAIAPMTVAGLLTTSLLGCGTSGSDNREAFNIEIPAGNEEVILDWSGWTLEDEAPRLALGQTLRVGDLALTAEAVYRIDELPANAPIDDPLFALVINLKNTSAEAAFAPQLSHVLLLDQQRQEYLPVTVVSPEELNLPNLRGGLEANQQASETIVALANPASNAASEANATADSAPAKYLWRMTVNPDPDVGEFRRLPVEIAFAAEQIEVSEANRSE